MKCARCDNEAVFIQLDDVFNYSTDWEVSCGCGDEPHYHLGPANHGPEMVAHVAKKKWSNSTRLTTLVRLRDQMGWGATA